MLVQHDQARALRLLWVGGLADQQCPMRALGEQRRDQPNKGDLVPVEQRLVGPLRILEIIAPDGLEELFQLMGAPDAPPDLLDDVEHTYGCEVDEEQTTALIQRHQLRA